MFFTLHSAIFIIFIDGVISDDCAGVFFLMIVIIRVWHFH